MAYDRNKACAGCVHQEPPREGWPTWGCKRFRHYYDQYGYPAHGPAVPGHQELQDWWDTAVCSCEDAGPCPDHTRVL
jgi:hypothetical protein